MATFSEIFEVLSKKQKLFMISHSVLNDTGEVQLTKGEEKTSVVLVAFYEMQQLVTNKKRSNFLSKYDGLNEISLYLQPCEFLKITDTSEVFYQRFQYYKKVLNGIASIEEIILYDPTFEQFELEATRVAIYLIETSGSSRISWKGDSNEMRRLLETHAIVCLYCITHSADRLNLPQHQFSARDVYSKLPRFMIQEMEKNASLHLSETRSVHQHEFEQPLPKRSKVASTGLNHLPVMYQDPFERILQLVKQHRDEWNMHLEEEDAALIDVLIKGSSKISSYFDRNWRQLSPYMMNILIPFIRENSNPLRKWLFQKDQVQRFLNLSFNDIMTNYVSWLQEAISLKRSIKGLFDDRYLDAFVEGCLLEIVKEHAKLHGHYLLALREPSIGWIAFVFCHLHPNTFDLYLAQIKMIIDVHQSGVIALT